MLFWYISIVGFIMVWRFRLEVITISNSLLADCNKTSIQYCKAKRNLTHFFIDYFLPVKFYCVLFNMEVSY